jgi:hypothetical protein
MQVRSVGSIPAEPATPTLQVPAGKPNPAGTAFEAETSSRQRLFFGGGYTYLAIVADVHPTTHAGNITRILSTVSFLANLGTTIQISAHTAAQPMAYPA